MRVGLLGADDSLFRRLALRPAVAPIAGHMANREVGGAAIVADTRGISTMDK